MGISEDIASLKVLKLDHDLTVMLKEKQEARMARVE